MTPLRHWTHSVVSEARFDVPDAPMAGEMDPFFFLTKDKNFIPHEYPCRTVFAERFRGKRPEPWGEAAQTKAWLPFGQDVLDLSGFWFRPTRIACHAATVVRSAGGLARFRLTTCGGAVVRIAGREVHAVSGYVRNWLAATEFAADLPAGEARVEVFFDDLAERDTRFLIRLEVEGAEAVSPFPEAAVAMEAALDAIRFDAPAYGGRRPGASRPVREARDSRTPAGYLETGDGQVAVLWPVPLLADADVALTVEGDFMSHERVERRFVLPAGAGRLVLEPPEAFPADFRHFRFEVTAGGFTAGRTLGVEIAHDAGPAPEAMAARIDEALEAVATKGEADAVGALARLATGRGADEVIDAVLPQVVDCWDCADFALVPLLWARARFADRIGAATLARLDAAIMGYRYWMDEPGNDVQWYFSENHALLFHTAAYLGGALLPEARFVRSGRTGAEQLAVGRDRVRAWLDHFEQWEMAEFNSAPYFPIDLKGLCALQALAPDADIRDRAAAGIARLVEIVANSAHQGVLTAAQGRSYEHTLRAGATLELSAIARLLWGAGSFGARFHALPQLALCLRDHGLTLPDLRERALWDRDDAQAWEFTQGEGRFAALGHWKTRDAALGTAARYRWGDWGYQETVVHARIGDDPQAQVWINSPGELIHSGYGRPSYWGGSASVPRVQQFRGLALVAFAGVAPQPDLTHAWFPTAVFDGWTLDGHVATARQAGGGLVLSASGPLALVGDGPTAGCELRLPGRDGVWLLRVTSGDPGRFAALAATRDGDTFCVDDPEYGSVRFNGDGTVEALGEVIDPATWTTEGRRRHITLGRDS